MSETGPGMCEGQRSEEVLEGIDASGSQGQAVLRLTVKRQWKVDLLRWDHADRMPIDQRGNSGELPPRAESLRSTVQKIRSTGRRLRPS